MWLVAHGDGEVELASSARGNVAQRRHFVDEIVRRGDVVYGVTTGFGKLSEMSIPLDRLSELQINLVRSHAAGVGALLPEREVRAMMLLRANVIAKGFSGARAELIDLLAAMLNAGLYPEVPEQGSVGASGDLAPLAHLALTLIGEGVLRRGNNAGPAAEMLEGAALTPVTLQPKEGITLINGTQAHTAIAAVALMDIQRLWRVAHAAGAMSLEGSWAPPTRSMSAFNARAASSASSAPPRSCARSSPTARSASRIARAIRACRMPTRCAACRRCTAPCSMRCSSRRGWCRAS